MRYKFLKELNHGITVSGLGHATGSVEIDNQSLLKKNDLRLKPSFIDKSIGIETRYYLSEEEGVSDIAAQAASLALEHAGLNVNDLSRLILATSSPDYQTPATACVVQHKLGGRGFPCVDINAACSGFIYGFDMAARAIATGDEHVLVIGADARSTDINFSDKRTVLLYGDGAGATVVSRSNRLSANDDSLGLINSLLYADGSGYDAVYKPVGGSKTPVTVDLVSANQHKLSMQDGRRVAQNALEGFAYLSSEVFNNTPYSKEDVDLFIFHQPNLRLLEQVINTLEIPINKTHINFQHYGNTVAGSIPLALSEAFHAGKIIPGNLVLLCGVGGGFTGGAHLIRWPEESGKV